MNEKLKKISVVVGCYNEEDNLQELYDRVTGVIRELRRYDYEIIAADNMSTDGSRAILRRLAAQDKNFKVIFNSRNYGQVRSPYNALLQADGDAVVAMCSDLQDPPELIADLVREWEKGANVVCAVNPQTRENPLTRIVRRSYYWLLAKFSENPQLGDFTGFGLYDRKFMEAMRKFHDPYPYFRGLVSEIGLKRAEVPFVKAGRKHGRTKNNFFTLYDVAMTGFVNHTKLPLRLAALCGFCLAALSLLVALTYFIYKLVYWQTFSMGIAPLIIGLFFFSAVQLIFIGIIGEYVGAIYTHVKNKPLVIEEEKLNFYDKPRPADEKN